MVQKVHELRNLTPSLRKWKSLQNSGDKISVNNTIYFRFCFLYIYTNFLCGVSCLSNGVCFWRGRMFGEGIIILTDTKVLLSLIKMKVIPSLISGDILLQMKDAWCFWNGDSSLKKQNCLFCQNRQKQNCLFPTQYHESGTWSPK